ncbi:MAG: acetolactate synthase small subunit [Dehalococcoidia bacterium]|nr:MAG: acetolactate synthase-1/3 small subunit [Chloroflexota bacterium]
MKHTVVALVEDKPGVLNRVASLFRRRGYNIDSLAVGTTHEIGVSRMTIVIEGNDNMVDQLEKQLYKLIEVIKVENFTSKNSIMRELALIKVKASSQNRREILEILEVFRAQAIDLSTASLVIQIVAHRDTIDALIENLDRFGILEMVRTGRIAMRRGYTTTTDDEDFNDEDTLRFNSQIGRLTNGNFPFVSD